MRSLIPVCFAAWTCACAQRLPVQTPESHAAATPVHLTFTPLSDSFQRAANEYDSLWVLDAARIIRSLESAAHLSFAEIGDTNIRAVVYEGVSNSGYRERPMQLRASYAPATKKAALMHELAHRLESGLFRSSEDDHPSLFLWLYDAWAAAYGEDFAREQVQIEKRRGGVYPAAWDSALALSRDQRAARWDSVRASRRGR